MIKSVIDNMIMALIGLFTGAFIGGFPLGHGVTGAMIGGLVGAALLVLLTILFQLKKWKKANLILKYGSIGILPGAFIGGSSLLGFGVKGAIGFAIIGAVFYATFIYKMIERHVETERYYMYRGHYALLFFLGSISVFITILIVDFVSHFVNFETVIMKIPFLLTTLLGIGLLAGLYFIGVRSKKKQFLDWPEAFQASHKLLGIVATIGVFLAIIITLTRMGYIPLNTMILGLAGLAIPLGVGLVMPLSLGYLLALNSNRPVMGAVYASVGSILVMYIGIQVAPILFLPGSGLMWAGLITGLFMIMLALMALVKPDTHLFAGGAIIIFSILSFLGAAGGLIIGGLLGLVGGVLIAAWDGDQTVTVDEDPQVPQISEDIPSVQSHTISY